MQESKNCELLFEYLRSILYDAKIETLNIFDLDEPYRKLGQGLQFLENAIGEMKSYSEALSHGNLSVDTPPRDNFLCENLSFRFHNLCTKTTDTVAGCPAVDLDGSVWFPGIYG